MLANPQFLNAIAAVSDNMRPPQWAMSLDLDFLTQTYATRPAHGPIPLQQKAFSDLITFTRASNGSYFDASGVMQYAASNVPRFDHDPVTLAPRGLLVEEQRTNLVPNSDTHDWSGNSGVSVAQNAAPWIDGTNTASLWTTTGASANPQAGKSIGGNLSGKTYTFSIWVRARASAPAGAALYMYGLPGIVDVHASNITITNTWQRYSLTATFASGLSATSFYARLDPMNGNASGIEFEVNGAQVEEGAFATSLISTTGSAATRVIDVPKIDESNFISFYNQNEGAFVLDLECQNIPGSAGRRVIDVAGSAEKYRLLVNQNARFYVDDGTNQVDITAPGAALSGITKIANAYKEDSFAVVTKGNAVATDSAGSLPVVSRLTVGSRKSGDANSVLNGWLRRIRYYPRRLPDEVLQALTV